MNTPHSSSISDATTTPSTWPPGPLLGLDTETTGVSPPGGRLVTATLVRRATPRADGVRPRSVTAWLADSGAEIPEAATTVHGVTTEWARIKGRSVTEVLTRVSEHLAAAMAVGTPVVAFSASYDLTLMGAELACHGLPTIYSRFDRELGPIVDLLVLDRAVDRYHRDERRLGDLCEAYDMCVNGALYTAEVDVAATLDVLEALTAAHPQLSELDPDELVTFQARAHRTWAESLDE